jgi:predicted enzyme related to lactoylglutathione lyase
MPTRSGYAEGIPSWVDLGTPDVGGAKAFYSAIFGWAYREEDAGSSQYFTALCGGLPAAGIGPLQDETTPSTWTTYFAVDDADATAARIREAGGAIVLEPSAVGQAGRLAIATDPTGAVFGIWEAGEHFGAAIVNEHGGLNWNELVTEDIEGATVFYGKVFGHESETEDWGEGQTYTTFKVGGRGIAGGAAKPGPDISNQWNIYFAVDDASAAINAATAAGGSVLREARETDGVGIIARLADPYGASFAIIQLSLEID